MDGNPRQTGFPEADRAARYGRFFEAVYTRMDQGKSIMEVWPSFQGLLNMTLAKARLYMNDPFWNAYRKICTKDDKPKSRSDMTLDDVNAVVLECESFWERAGLWNYEATPTVQATLE